MKKTIYTIFILYVVLTTVLLVISLFSQKKELYFNSIDGYKEKIAVLKNEALLKDEKCSKALTKLINTTEKGYVEGEISVKDYFNKLTEVNWLSDFVSAKGECNYESEDINTIALTAFVQADEIIQDYYFDYEVKLRDILIRNIVEPSLLSVRNKIKNELELKAIEMLIKGDSNE